MKITIVGAGGQGKTSLVKRLVSDLKIEGYDSVEILEYARSYIEKCGAPENPWEQWEIMMGQYHREKDADGKYDIVVCDINPWVAAAYTPIFVDFKNKKHLHMLKKIMDKAIDTCHDYDYIFYLPKIFKVEMDSVRKDWSGDEDQQKLDASMDKVDNALVSFMNLFGMNYIPITVVGIDERVQFIREHIKLEGKK